MNQTTPPKTPESSLLATIGGGVERLFLGLAKPVRWATRGWLPYGYHIVESIARAVAYLVVSIPILAGFLGLASFSIGGPSHAIPSLVNSAHQIEVWLLLIQSDPHLLAGAIVSVYFLFGVLPYEPKDWHMQAWRTRNRPEPPYEWEFTVYTLAAAIPATGIFLVWVFAQTLPAVLPYGWYGVLVGMIGVSLLPFWWTRRRAYAVWSESTEERLTRDTLTTNGFLHLLVGVSLAVGGVGVGVEQGAFPALAVTMGWVIRRMRWMLYEDRDAFLDFTPSVTLWSAVTRIPYAYALTVAVLTTPSNVMDSTVLSACLLVPLGALGLYYGLRYYRTNGRMYLRFPRVEYDPDDWDIREYIRRTSPLLNHEQSQALRPKNQMWVAIRKTRWHVTAVNRALAASEGDFPSFSPFALAKLADDSMSTYETRKADLARVNGFLSRTRRQVESYEGDDADDLLAVIAQAENAAANARELNEEVGKRFSDAVVRAFS